MQASVERDLVGLSLQVSSSLPPFSPVSSVHVCVPPTSLCVSVCECVPGSVCDKDKNEGDGGEERYRDGGEGGVGEEGEEGLCGNCAERGNFRSLA